MGAKPIVSEIVVPADICVGVIAVVGPPACSLSLAWGPSSSELGTSFTAVAENYLEAPDPAIRDWRRRGVSHRCGRERGGDGERRCRLPGE